MTTATASYLPPGLPAPVPEHDDLSRPFWDGLKQHRILVQRCGQCGTWQWGPEWICHACRAFDPDWVEVSGEGAVESHVRVWHPVHPALEGHGPYLAVLVSLPQAGGIRMVGNLLGDPQQAVPIGAAVTASFEDHVHTDPPFTLLQWKLRRPAQ